MEMTDGHKKNYTVQQSELL